MLVSYLPVIVTICFIHCINPPNPLASGFPIPPNLNQEAEPTLSPSESRARAMKTKGNVYTEITCHHLKNIKDNS